MMETTFMSIHNLSPDASILFASASIVDILGYQPHEVTGRSCFDYFHQDDIPFARSQHRQAVELGTAASLYYARIRTRENSWVSCECVFTVVHNVLVACTSIYKGDIKSTLREAETRNIRRIFSSPPRDPRYHMLDYLAPKFTAAPEPATGEPRAALILNRFSRTLPIMYSTDSVVSVLGVTTDDVHGKSFYECIEEECLPEAIRCVEGAKANDSIAYLRFVFRDPRPTDEPDESDEEASSDSDDGGVQLNDRETEGSDVLMEGVERRETGNNRQGRTSSLAQASYRTESGSGTDIYNDSRNAIFDTQPSINTNSSVSSPPPLEPGRTRSSASNPLAPAVEIEAVISCTSDGLVVIIRAAPIAPRHPEPVQISGLFAAPWAAEPIIPLNQPAPVTNPRGPPMGDFMRTIRDVAVFAWALTGINGNIASYSHGTPRGEATPPSGFPIWDPQEKDNNDPGPENQAARRWAERERIQSADAGHQMPLQQSQNQSSNQNSGSNIGTANPMAQRHFPDQSGFDEPGTRHRQC